MDKKYLLHACLTCDHLQIRELPRNNNVPYVEFYCGKNGEFVSTPKAWSYCERWEHDE